MSVIDGSFLIQKMNSKGGWSYVLLPDLFWQKKAFGMIRMSGSVDDLELRSVTLWSTKEKQLFLPLKAEIRKKIKKEAGDHVHIFLKPDETVALSDDDLLTCLHDEPTALKRYKQLSLEDQEKLSNHIKAALNTETRINRIAELINKLSGS